MPSPSHVPHTAQQLGAEYLVQQAKFGVLLLWVFTAGVRVFLHQENISLFTLENKTVVLLYNNSNNALLC